MCLVCSYKVDAFVYEMHVSAATCCLLFVELQMLQMLCSSRASLTATNVGGVQITWHSHFAFSLASRTLKVCAHLWHFHNVVLSLVIFSVANQCLDLTYRLFFMSVWNMLELQFELYLYPLPHPSSSPYLQTGLMFISGRPSALLIRLLAFLLFLRRPSFPSLCCSSLSSSFLISIFSLVELSCKLYMLVWQYGAVNSCWCTHSHTHTLLITAENFQSECLCCVSQCRGWWCSVQLWRWTDAFIVALMHSRCPPRISSITTQFQIHFLLLWTSCNIFFLLQLFLQTHFLHSRYLFNFHTSLHFSNICLFSWGPPQIPSSQAFTLSISFL